MGQVPWLVVHGTAFWQTVVVLAGLVGAGWGTLRARCAARRDADHARAALGVPGTLDGVPDGQVVTLQGTLDAAAAVDQIPGEVTPVGRTPRTLALRVDGARVGLEGHLVITAGALELRTGRGGPSRWDERPWSPALRVIRPGDRVVARGTAGTRAGAPSAEGYRGSAEIARVLTSTPGQPLTLATADVPVVSGPPGSRNALRALATSGLCFLTLWCMGRGAAAVGQTARTGAWDITVIASALPGQRSASLRRLEALAAAWPPGPAVAPTRVGLALVRGDCDTAVEAAMDHGALGLAAETARGCGLYHREAMARYALGDFVAASAAVAHETSAEPSPGALLWDAEVHLLAGEVLRAAAVIDRLAAVTEARGNTWLTEPTLGVATRVRVHGLRCVSAALRARGGDATARHPLAAGAVLGDRVCSVLWADLQDTTAEKITALAAPALAAPPGEPLQDVVRLLTAETVPAAEGESTAEDCARGADLNLGLHAGLHPGLDGVVLRGLTHASGYRVHLALQVARMAAIAGDPGEVQTALDQARADAVTVGAECRRTVEDAAQAMARGGRTDAGPRLPWATDGAVLVAAAQDLNATDETAGWLTVAAPRVTRNRMTLARWVHWGDQRRGWTRGPLERLEGITRRRTLTTALGDRVLGGELAAVQRQYATALRQRDLAVIRAVLATP